MNSTRISSESLSFLSSSLSSWCGIIDAEVPPLSQIPICGREIRDAPGGILSPWIRTSSNRSSGGGLASIELSSMKFSPRGRPEIPPTGSWFRAIFFPDAGRASLLAVSSVSSDGDNRSWLSPGAFSGWSTWCPVNRFAEGPPLEEVLSDPSSRFRPSRWISSVGVPLGRGVSPNHLFLVDRLLCDRFRIPVPSFADVVGPRSPPW